MSEVPRWSSRLRRERLRPDRMWSLAQMARELRRAAGVRVAVAHPASLRRQIGGWERGEHLPDERYRILYALVFAIPERELFAGAAAPGTAPGPGAADDVQELAEPAPRSRKGGATAGEAAAQVRAASAQIIALDTRLGAGDMLDLVVRAAERAHRTAHAEFPGNREVLAAAAEAQQVAGWVCFDAERQDLARRLSLEALLSARTSGDRSMEYFVLAQLAMQDLHVHRPGEAAQICEAALEGASGSVGTLFTMRAARAAAQMGEHARARDLIGRTRSRYLDGPRSGDPAWAWWLTEGEISWHHAMLCADAGQWGRAGEHFAVAADAELASGYDRGACVSRANLLWALAQARDWAEAERVLVREVLPRRGQVASGRAERTLGAAARLLDKAPGRPSLREAARALLPAAPTSQASDLR
ncbi:DNA-binding protein [Nonomuraea sp. NPDC050547]|uniref:DNA-binding protein n=1 Tax=Nonomuraea sp. NPDC050547 TaxID=3364368 RepID=UPI0037B47620